nr:unnamed protein product [Callosobruchus analis]
MLNKTLFHSLLLIVTWFYNVEGGFYKESDGVQILTSENLNSTIYRSEYGWMVQFYSSQCGYCELYAPVMKEFANDIDSWKDLVKIGTLDCAVYSKTCKQLYIKTTPTFKYFYPDQVSGDGRLIGIDFADTVDTTRHILVNLLIEEQIAHRAHNLPSLQVYRGDDIEELINTSKTQYVLLTIEEPGTTFGAELALYFHNVPEITIRFSHYNNYELLEKLGPKVYPALYVISKDGTHKLLTAYGDRTKTFKVAVERFMKSKDLKIREGGKDDDSIPDGKGGLYKKEDGVEILTSENISSTIFLSKYEWMVEFYRSSCGYCRRYAPVMKQFADDIDTWKDLVKIGTLDCDVYIETCKKFHVKRTPTFRYFYRYQFSGAGRQIEIDSTYTVEATKHELVNVLIDQQNRHRGLKSPSLQAYKGAVFEELLSGPRTEYGLLIIDKPESTLGAELALYFHQVPEVRITYSHYDNYPLLKKLGSNAYPALYAISQDSKHKALTVYGTNSKAFKAAVERFLKSKGFKVPKGTKHDHSRQYVENLSLIRYVRTMGDQVYLGDLESAVRFSLKSEVFMKDVLNRTEVEALTEFIRLVQKYVPLTKQGKKLMTHIEYDLTHLETVTGALIKQLIDIASKEDEHVFLTDQRWIGCVGQSEAYRGYPCSLWKLFHYLTVNAALDPSVSFFDGGLIIQGMHAYIKHFFSCENCKNNFLAMAERRRYQSVVTKKEAVLWLWEAHNEVNQRLHGDVTEDENFPKVQFPLAENCPKCRNHTGEYNRDEVTFYLLNMYASQHINYFGANNLNS